MARLQIFEGFEHYSVFVQKRNVDREFHTDGVNGGARHDVKAFAHPEMIALQEPDTAIGKGFGGSHPGCQHHAAVAIEGTRQARYASHSEMLCCDHHFFLKMATKLIPAAITQNHVASGQTLWVRFEVPQDTWGEKVASQE
jgi:hypothetical protein